MSTTIWIYLVIAFTAGSLFGFFACSLFVVGDGNVLVCSRIDVVEDDDG